MIKYIRREFDLGESPEYILAFMQATARLYKAKILPLDEDVKELSKCGVIPLVDGELGILSDNKTILMGMKIEYEE